MESSTSNIHAAVFRRKCYFYVFFWSALCLSCALLLKLPVFAVDCLAAEASPPVSVSEFGAAGDGITDDTQAIRQAVSSGRDLTFPPGTYRITDAITIPNDDVSITGSGFDSVVFADMDVNAFIFTGHGSYIGNLAIEGNKSPVSPVHGRTAIKFYDASSCTAENIRIKDVNTGGIGTGGASGSNDIVIKNASIENTWEHGVYVSTTSNAVIENVTVRDAGRNQGVNGGGLKISNSNNITVTDYVSTNSLSAAIVLDAARNGDKSTNIKLINVTGITPEAGQYGLYINRDVSRVNVYEGHFEGDYGIKLNGDPDDMPDSIMLADIEAKGTGQYAFDVSWGTDVYTVGGTLTGPAGGYAARARPDAGNLYLAGVTDVSDYGYSLENSASFVMDMEEFLLHYKPAGSGRPDLSYAMDCIYWHSYADYLDRLLTVDYTIRNNGLDAYQMAITGIAASNGVRSIYEDNGRPLLPAGSSNVITIKYAVPQGVSVFKSTLFCEAADACGTVYSYPPPQAGV